MYRSRVTFATMEAAPIIYESASPCTSARSSQGSFKFCTASTRITPFSAVKPAAHSSMALRVAARMFIWSICV